MTNAHVVDYEGKPLKEVEVETYDGKKLTGKVLGVNQKLDLAVVKIDIKNAVPLSLAKTNPQTGDMVATMGHPLGIPYYMSFGIVGANNRWMIFQDDVEFKQAHLTDAQFNQGISGGPLVNMNGEVVGVNRAMLLAEGATLGISVPATVLDKVLKKLMKDPG